MLREDDFRSLSDLRVPRESRQLSPLSVIDDEPDIVRSSQSSLVKS